MPAKRKAMRKIKEVLRLKFEAGLSHELLRSDHQFDHRGIAFQIHPLMLDAAPERLDEDVVERSPLSIHADDNAFMTFQHVGEGFAGELFLR